jgi:hypothetical protein
MGRPRTSAPTWLDTLPLLLLVATDATLGGTLPSLAALPLLLLLMVLNAPEIWKLPRLLLLLRGLLAAEDTRLTALLPTLLPALLPQPPAAAWPRGSHTKPSAGAAAAAVEPVGAGKTMTPLSILLPLTLLPLLCGVVAPAAAAPLLPLLHSCSL